jgi:imidazolonepropionase-like amidohydrolase
MHMRLPLSFVTVWLFSMQARANAPSPEPAPAAPPTILRAAHLFDGKSDRLVSGLAVLVQGDRIIAVDTWEKLSSRAPDARVIDLGAATLLPGLVDGHTHITDSGGPDYATTLLKESLPYRALRAAANVHYALDHGFTALRDVESEGAMYVDADVQRAIERGLVPGPRLAISTRGLAPTGGYFPRDVAWDLGFRTGAQLVDGIDDIRHAVREQVSHGANWIKVYADFGAYLTGRADRPQRSRPNFTFEEMKALVEETHRLGRRVAAHATGWDGIDMALRAGVDSIEHGDGINDELADRMRMQGVFLCPTIYALRSLASGSVPPTFQARLDIHKAAIQRAIKHGVKVANGSDAGSFPWTDNPVRELYALVDYGMTPVQALRAATSVAGGLFDRRCLPDERDCPHGQVGQLAAGSFADMIAVDGDPTADLHALERLRFIMIAGAVYR